MQEWEHKALVAAAIGGAVLVAAAVIAAAVRRTRRSICAQPDEPVENRAARSGVPAGV